MSELHDSKYLNEVSLPGTHDSGARHGGAACETHSWSIANQLKAGIRFFDIRCRRAGTVFAIHHGRCFQNIFFGDVLIDVQNFLSAHPKEFVLMRIKEEYTPMDGSSSFSSIWSTYMNRFGNLFVDSQSSMPTVGQLRGKILALTPSSLRDKGIQYGGSLTAIQDIFKVYWLLNDNPFGRDTASLPQKKRLVRSYIDKAATSSKIVLNYLSGAGGMIPKDVARATNGNTYDHIGPYKNAKRVGVIIMDFPGEKLVYRVIKSNRQGFGYCRKETFRGQSAKTWAEFRLPIAIEGTVITIKGGAYARYVFPRCHRVTWTDQRFECTARNYRYDWVKRQGSTSSDAWCHNSNSKQQYLKVGRR